MARQATRLWAQCPPPGVLISLAGAVGAAAAVTPDLSADSRGRSFEALCDPPYRPTGGNASRNLFALLKPQRSQSPPAWRWSNPSIASQDPIDAALVPPLKRSRDVRHTLTALPALPQLSLLFRREPGPCMPLHSHTSSSAKIRRCCVDSLNSPGQSGQHLLILSFFAFRPKADCEDSRSGNRGMSARQGFRPYSGLMLAARITLPHFSVCSTTILSSSAGEPVNAVAPSSANRAAILGLVSPALISLLSLSTTSTGVFLGAPIPTHALASKPGWNSASVGISGKACQRVALMTARARSLPVLMCSIDAGRLSMAACTCPPSRSVTMGAEPR